MGVQERGCIISCMCIAACKILIYELDQFIYLHPLTPATSTYDNHRLFLTLGCRSYFELCMSFFLPSSVRNHTLFSESSRISKFWKIRKPSTHTISLATQTLLNTTRKALESTMAHKMSHPTEEFQLIPSTWKGRRRRRFTE